MWRAVIDLCCCLAIICAREVAKSDQAKPAEPSALALSEPVNQVGVLAREPMVVQHPGGALFVTGYGGGSPHLWRSDDKGATWSAANVGGEKDGAVGNSDVDLAVARDGTLYFVVMSFDRTKGEGTQIAIGTSRDTGTSWTWTLLSKTRYDDRPWVEVAPDGTAHVIWNDGNGVSYARSRDRGRSWQEQPRIHPQGHSSHLAIGPSGEIAVRITPVSASGNINHAGVDLVAVSTDGGATWSKHAAPGVREWPFPIQELLRWVEPLAWDATGHLYYLWTDPAGLWLARSTDRGEQWKTWQIAHGGELRYFPYLIARGKGELAATWFSGRGERIQVQLARIDAGAGDATPRVTEAPPFTPDSWQRSQKSGEPRNRDPAGEYAPVAFLLDGRLAVVTTIQDFQEKRLGFAWRTAELR
jgi:BNR/Asp-box repeat